jgi:MFS family permease
MVTKRVQYAAVPAPQYSKDPQVEDSLRLSVRDGVAYSIMTGMSESYFSVYAVFLRATTAQIAFLAAIPPLLGSAAQLFSAWLARRMPRRKPIILIGVAWQLSLLLPMIWLPYLFPERAVSLFIACTILYFAAFNLASPIWSSMMGDLVPERRRGRYFARRTRLMSLTAFTGLWLAGIVLHFGKLQNQTRFAFLIIFTLALVARLYSLTQIARMTEPPSTTALPEPIVRRDILRRIRHSQFARFSLFYSFLNIAVTIVSPFITVYLLRDLKFSYLEFTTSAAMYVMAQFLTLNLWGRISDALGNRLILVVTGPTIAIIPWLWLLSTNLWYIVGLQIFGGLTWAGFSLSANNFMYDTVAPGKRATYMAFHNVLANAGIFVGSLLGGYLGTHLSATATFFGHTIHWPSQLCWLFVLSAIARTAVALLFIPHLKEVRDVPQRSAGWLIFRVTQFHALAGFIFSIFPFGQRPEQTTHKTRVDKSG